MLIVRNQMDMKATLAAIFALCCLSACNVAEAWNDQGHMAIARAAGLKSYHNACAPDVTKQVMNINNYKDTAGQAHFYDAVAPITKADVYKQLEIIETHDGMEDGYVLGAIVHAIRVAKESSVSNKSAEYTYDILAHYIGDAVQPLHMSVYDAYNKEWHIKTDGIMEYPKVKWDVEGAIKLSKELKVDDRISFSNEYEVIDYLVIIANESYYKGEELRKENRPLTRKEAIERASRGASFLRAVLRYCGYEVVKH